MINLGVESDLTRRFLYKMSSISGMQDDQAKLLFQLQANMSRANDMMTDDTPLNATMTDLDVKFKKGDAYVLTGYDSKTKEKESLEGRHLFDQFLESKEEKEKV